MRPEIIGFAPDLDPATPGVLTYCNALVPTLRGMSTANSPIPTAYPNLGATPTSAFVAELLDGTKRMFVASATKIYEGVSNAWTDRSRGGDYTSTNRTRFAVFGNVVLSANRTQAIGQANAGGSFSDISGAPTALLLVPASGFVVALNINGMSQGDAPDGWGCCAIRNQSDWTPSVATQCAAGRLLDSPGAIRAGAALGGDVIAYKASSMYIGRYVGPPLVWAWTRVPGDVGCSGAESVVVVGTRHFFVGPDDFYMFDGTVPRPIGTPVREWFFGQLSRTYRDRIIGVADPVRDLVYWYYPAEGTNGNLYSCLVYNIKTDRWGRFDTNITTAVQYSSGQVTYDALGGMYATYDDLPNIAYDSPFWLADQSIPGVFLGDKLHSLTGVPGDSTFITGDYGDLENYTFLTRLQPRWVKRPSTGWAQGTNFFRDELDGQPLFPGDTVEMSEGRFDFRRSARWHRFRVDQRGSATVNGLSITLHGAGSE